MRPAIDHTLGQDIDFLSPALRKAYINILTFDCFLNHPFYQLLIHFYGNANVNYDDYFHPFKFPKHLHPNDVVLFEAMNPKKYAMRYKFWDSFTGFDRLLEYWGRYTVVGDYQPYIEDFIFRTYETLPNHEKRSLPLAEYCRFIIRLFLKLGHDKIFSCYGKTLLGVYARNSWIDMNSATMPDNWTTKIRKMYRELDAKEKAHQQTATAASSTS